MFLLSNQLLRRDLNFYAPLDIYTIGTAGLFAIRQGTLKRFN